MFPLLWDPFFKDMAITMMAGLAFATVLHGRAVEVELGPGDVAFHPRNEWHGFRNTSPTEEAEMIWTWVGASSKEQAGYILRDTRGDKSLERG